MSDTANSSLVIQIADAVVAELNAAELHASDPGVAAARHYRPQFELAELKSVRVTVVPKAIEVAALSRSQNQHDVAIDIAIQKKLQTADLAELDPLMDLVQALGDLLRLKRLAAFPSATWLKTENAPIYSPEHIDQHRVFTSVLTVTYRLAR